METIICPMCARDILEDDLDECTDCKEAGCTRCMLDGICDSCLDDRDNAEIFYDEEAD